MYCEQTDTFLLAAKAAAMLTPGMFGGYSAIRGAKSAKDLQVDPRSLESDEVCFSDRAYALMVQSITAPEKAEKHIARSGSTLTPGRLLPTLGHNRRKALARLMMAVPTN